MFLETLGFRRIGRHCCKSVELFGQGEVRVILNLEEDSFARGYFEALGVCACAVALGTTDALRRWLGLRPWVARAWPVASVTTTSPSLRYATTDDEDQ